MASIEAITVRSIRSHRNLPRRSPWSSSLIHLAHPKTRGVTPLVQSCATSRKEETCPNPPFRWKQLTSDQIMCLVKTGLMLFWVRAEGLAASFAQRSRPGVQKPMGGVHRPCVLVPLAKPCAGSRLTNRASDALRRSGLIFGATPEEATPAAWRLLGVSTWFSTLPFLRCVAPGCDRNRGLACCRTVVADGHPGHGREASRFLTDLVRAQIPADAGPEHLRKRVGRCEKPPTTSAISASYVVAWCREIFQAISGRRLWCSGTGRREGLGNTQRGPWRQTCAFIRSPLLSLS
jgi:hypothetical protein